MAEEPGKKSDSARKAAARQERLTQSLRANLRRRKGQKKGRSEDVNLQDEPSLNPNHGEDGQGRPQAGPIDR